jgi:hypothetical protein
MASFSTSGIIYNNPSKLVDLPPYVYRSSKCDTNLTTNTPASQYQRLKIIQKTVRVASSLYTSNLGPLNAYKKPTAVTQNVCWNQMSDRPEPSVQRATIPTGFNSSMNRRHTSVTSSKPGCQTPGGIGCDIKHNSYDRYLNRLKGKGPLRRGVIPPGFGIPNIPFNRAFPIYGAKTTKTSIVSGCDCPIVNAAGNLKQNIQIYNNPYWQPNPSFNYNFKVGDYVYAIETGNELYKKALVVGISSGGVYTIEFLDGTRKEVNNVNELLIYFPCNCSESISSEIGTNGYSVSNLTKIINSTAFCNLLTDSQVI